MSGLTLRWNTNFNCGGCKWSNSKSCCKKAYKGSWEAAAEEWKESHICLPFYLKEDRHRIAEPTIWSISQTPAHSVSIIACFCLVNKKASYCCYAILSCWSSFCSCFWMTHGQTDWLTATAQWQTVKAFLRLSNQIKATANITSLSLMICIV